MFKLFEKDDSHEFLPIMAEIEEEPQNPLGSVIFWIIVGAMAFFVIWMCVGKVDVVITARGTVIPEGDVKIIQPLETGVVSAILCKEGDFVKEKQVLIEIDPSITEPELKSKKKSLQYLQLEKSRINSLLGSKPFHPEDKGQDSETLNIQRQLYDAASGSLQKQLEAKKAELDRVGEDINAARKDKKYNEDMLVISLEKEARLKNVLDIIPKNEYEKTLNDILTFKNNIEQLDHKLAQAEYQAVRVKSEAATIEKEFKTTSLKEYSERQKQSTEIQAEIDKNAFRNEKQRILSPVEGHISNLFIHTVGGVVTPAQKILSVVPVATPLVIKAVLLNKDIGFVGEQLPVSIKIDTFDFQKYGILKGRVRNISKHSVEDEKLGHVYEVFIQPEENELMVEGEKMKISSGMTLTAEVKVENRRIIEFFIYPITKYLDEGLSVR
ncbi:MAG: HlyD family type I secretion periplasmic adaptor subunit [Desulfobacterales bacterium]|jgi:hemolysin D|nr:HlyD family type I secretion periplasmic adaptor subunit [Desulfobacterales bacterium]